MMSTVKVNKPGSTPVTAKAGQPAPPAKNKCRKIEKHWNKTKFTKKKPPPKDQGKATFSLPPTDPQQFSANWKTLLEVLKTSTPEKSHPAKTQPAQQKKHSSFKVEVQKKLTKNISGKDGSPTQGDTGKVRKNKTPPSKGVSKVSQMNGKGPTAAETEQNPKVMARKRRQASGKANSEQAAKRKKVEVETKPTEADLWFDDVDPDDIEATVGTEAADIMRKKQGHQRNTSQEAQSALVKEKAFEGLTRAVAMDCEMVGVGPDGEDSIVARVSLVNQFGKCIYDKYVKPTEKVTDYRTAVSGIRPEDIKDGEDVQSVQREVAEILQGRILVGHAIHNDLKILLLDHPKKKIRDTQKYKPFKRIVKSGRPALKVLCREILNVKVQQGEHSSVQDAQATMRLYTLVKKQWEAEIKASRKTQTRDKDSNKKSERKPRIPTKK